MPELGLTKPAWETSHRAMQAWRTGFNLKEVAKPLTGYIRGGVPWLGRGRRTLRSDADETDRAVGCDRFPPAWRGMQILTVRAT